MVAMAPPAGDFVGRVAKMVSMLDCPFVVGGPWFSIIGPLGIQLRRSNLT